MSQPSQQRGWNRIVVNLACDALHGRLAESRFVERKFLFGGEGSLYQLAFAVAQLGYDVELRGWLSRADFERYKERVGASPRVELEARLPTADDLLIVPEGWRDPLEFARLILSPARVAIVVLAPPGLFGWPFVDGPWQRPDPITVPLDAVARPEHFQGMAALDLRLATHSQGLADAANAAGVACSFIGEGLPGWEPLPEAEKPVDVAALAHNRWVPLADRVLAQLGDLELDRIEEVDNDEMLRRLSRARVLLWPSRIEGHARIPWEARSVGCVPVALSSNRFAVGLDADHGAVPVDEVEEMAPMIRALLEDSERWEQLSSLGRATAPAEVDWGRFVVRVQAFLEEPWPGQPTRAPLAGIGQALTVLLDRREADAKSRLDEIALARVELEAAAENQERLTLENQWLEGELRGVLARRAVRAALRLSKLLDRDA